MKATEILEVNQPALRTITIMVPQNTQQLVIDLIQQLANQLTSQAQPLSAEQLQTRIDAVENEKMRQLVINKQNKQIWDAGNMVTPDNRLDALAISKGEMPADPRDTWKPVDPRGKR